MNRPKLSTAVWLSLLSVAWMLVSIGVYINFGPEWIFVVALVLIEFIWIVAAGVSWLYWMWYEYIELDRERRRVESITPFTEAADRVLRLTKEQLDFLGLRGYHAMIGVIPTFQGPRQVVITPEGFIPIEDARRILRSTGVIRWPEIRNTSDGSNHRDYLRWLINWSVSVGLADPPRGPNPAMWKDKDSRAIAANIIGIDIYGNGIRNGDEEGDDE